jgi:acylpyruvate hydrolase
LQVDGVEKQRGNTADMIFKLPELLAHISSMYTLLPGDIVLSGTPSGVSPVKPGQKMRCGITGIMEVLPYPSLPFFSPPFFPFSFLSPSSSSFQ